MNGALGEIESNLAAKSWDSSREVVLLGTGAIKSILRRFVENEVTAAMVSGWANMIEGREDVGWNVKDTELISKFIHEAANPALEGPITGDWASNWLKVFG
jgi:hypothetical protein